MELAGALGRTPREFLASTTLPEFRAYVLLSADRADDMKAAQAAPAKKDDAVDLAELNDAEIARAFGATPV